MMHKPDRTSIIDFIQVHFCKNLGHTGLIEKTAGHFQTKRYETNENEPAESIIKQALRF